MRMLFNQQSKRFPLWILHWIAAGLVACVLGCDKKASLITEEAKDTRKNASLQRQLEQIQGVVNAPNVPVVKLKPGSISEALSITGELVPSNSIVIKPLMEGRISFVRPIKVGDQVKKGELIARIDDRDIEDDIEFQQKQIALGTEKIALDEQTLEQSKKDLEFDRKLVKEGFLNQHEFEKTEMELKKATLGLNQSRITLEQDKSKLNKAQRLREKVPIIAPIDGMVVLPAHLTSDEKTFNLLNEEILSLEGMLVATSTPIFGIVSREGYLAQCQANGRDKAKIEEGQSADVTIISHKPITVSGKVTKMSLLQDAKTHAYKVWISLDQADKSFTSGLFVRADIKLAKRNGVFVVAKEFVKERNNRQFVQIVEKNTVKDRWITAGLSEEDKVELETGVEANEMLIASKEVFAAEQAVQPVLVKEEEKEQEATDLSVLPIEAATLPFEFSEGLLKPKLLTFKVDDNPSSYTRALLLVTAMGVANDEQLRISLPPSSQLLSPEKMTSQGDKQILRVEFPLASMKKGENPVSVAFVGNAKKPITLKAMELRLYR